MAVQRSELEATASDALSDVERSLTAEREAHERLCRVDEMRRTILGVIAHDMRSPLSAAFGVLTALESDEAAMTPAVERAGALTALGSALRQMERFIEQLLDVDTWRSDDVALRRRTVSVAELIGGVTDQVAARERREITADLEPVIMAVDVFKVERIVENLLMNAARHTPAGTPIWASLRGTSTGVLISIEDAGPGVTLEARKAMFRHERRSVGALRHGLGIGLSLVACLAELHGGEAWFEERPGGGAAFRVALPSDERVTVGMVGSPARMATQAAEDALSLPSASR